MRLTVRCIGGIGPVQALIDTAALSICIYRRLFEDLGEILQGDDYISQDVGGKELKVVGNGYLSFDIWGHIFREVHVKVLERLPSGSLIGRRFCRINKLVLDL